MGTVAPPLLTSSTLPSNDSNSNTIKLQPNRTKISDISKSHPYSALWAQIGDLYGSIGSPPKMSKTIICGNQLQSMDKILNVLTYFIRCGEITRNPKEKIIEKHLISNIMDNVEDHCLPLSDNTSVKSNNSNISENVKKPSGMVRTATCLKDLKGLITDNSEFIDEQNTNLDLNIPSDINNEQVVDAINIFKKNVMNDIPNVLVYRDSRFVKQELRIGNLQMDTGIEMTPKLKNDLRIYQLQQKKDSIKLTLTSPDNIEYSIATNGEDDSLNLSELVRDTKILQNLHNETSKLSRCSSQEHPAAQTPDNLEFRRSKSLYTKSSKAKNSNHIINRSKLVRKTSVPKIELSDESVCSTTLTQVPSLSDLITLNSLGNNQRLNWCAETEKVVSDSNIIMNSENNKSNADSTNIDSNTNGVVFVLGEDEQLIDIRNNKKSIQAAATLPKLKIASTLQNESETASQVAPIQQVHNKMCKHKYKKHSGVKFNFEQYPQIATNYMKNKNLDISNYNFHEKGFKIEQEMRLNYGASTSTLTSSKGTLSEDDEECECCRSGGGGHFLTTPSNASELEFSCDLSDDNNDLLSTPTNASELEYSCNSNLLNDNGPGISSPISSQNNSTSQTNEINNRVIEKQTKAVIKLNNSSTNNSKCSSGMKIVRIPLPKSKVKENCDGGDSRKSSLVIFDPGFIPSLLIGITDHYIPDMILQVS